MTDLMEEAMDAVSAPSASELASIESLVNRALELTRELETVDEYAKKLKAELHMITSSQLVDLLASAGTTEFKTKDVKVSVKDFISGSLPKEEGARAEAIRWIESVGAADIVKNHLEADFDKKQDNLAGQVEEFLENLGVEFVRSRDVHHSTLKSFANERMKNGEELPLETLGLFAGRKAEIKVLK
jgi:hypothetical protein